MATNAKYCRYDLAWRRENQFALLTLCLIFFAATIAYHLSINGTDDRHIPIRRDLVAAAAEKIDPNTASSASLQRLPGIGPSRANAIIEYRNSQPKPALATAGDLAKVRGIGGETARRIAPFMNVK